MGHPPPNNASGHKRRSGDRDEYDAQLDLDNSDFDPLAGKPTMKKLLELARSDHGSWSMEADENAGGQQDTAEGEALMQAMKQEDDAWKNSIKPGWVYRSTKRRKRARIITIVSTWPAVSTVPNYTLCTIRQERTLVIALMTICVNHVMMVCIRVRVT